MVAINHRSEVECADVITHYDLFILADSLAATNRSCDKLLVPGGVTLLPATDQVMRLRLSVPWQKQSGPAVL